MKTYLLLKPFPTLRQLLTCLIALLLIGNVQAQDFFETGPASSTNADKCGGDAFEITPNLNGQAGAIWSKDFYDFTQPIKIDFSMYFGDNNSGGDGMAIIFQPFCPRPASGGSGLGYEGIPNSIVIEFDTYANGINADNFNDHLHLSLNGVISHNDPGSLTGVVLVPGLSDFEIGTCIPGVLTWDPVTTILNLDFGGANSVINYNFGANGYDVNTIFGGSDLALVGVTGSTGGVTNEQEVAIYPKGVRVPIAEISHSCIPNSGAVDFIPPGGTNFNWTGPNGFTATTEDISGLEPGTYTLSYQIETCNATVDFIVRAEEIVTYCNPVTLVLDSTNSAILTVADIDNGSYYTCGAITTSLSRTDFTCADVGVTTIVDYIVSEPGGLTETCSAEVTIVNNPIIYDSIKTVYTEDRVCSGDGMIDFNRDNSSNYSWTGPNGFTATTEDISGLDVGTYTLNYDYFDCPTTPVSYWIRSKGIDQVCMNATLTLDATGNATLTPSDVDGGSTYECGPLTPSLEQTDFTCADLGSTFIRYILDGGNGEAVNCFVRVTVLSGDPVLTTTTDDCGGLTGAIDFEQNNASNFSWTGPNGFTATTEDISNLEVGFYTVTYDYLTCSVSESYDIITAEIDQVCQNVTLTLDAAQQATLTAADVGAGTSYDCTSLSESLSQTTFDCSDIGPNIIEYTVTSADGMSSTCEVSVTIENGPDSDCPCVAPTDVLIDFEDSNTCSTSSGGDVNCFVTGTAAALMFNNKSDDMGDWRIRSGATGSSDTGPDSGYLGSGNYMYAEASSFFNSSLVLDFKCVDLSSFTTCGAIEFQQHAWGEDMGTFHLSYSLNSGVWDTIYTVSGDQGNQWNAISIPLPVAAQGQPNVQFKFSFVTGDDYESDFAFDDLIIRNCDPNLSIDLNYFKGKTLNRSHLLKWQTITETESDYFSLKRSKNGADFREIAQIKGAGNSYAPLNYEFLDRNPINGTSYYQLSSIDLSGKVTNSEVVALTLKETDDDLEIFPNPFSDEINVRFLGTEEEKMWFTVFDISGKIVYETEGISSEHINNHLISLKGLPSGSYLLRVLKNDATIFKRIIKAGF